jgi:hypothetical protein
VGGEADLEIRLHELDPELDYWIMSLTSDIIREGKKAYAPARAHASALIYSTSGW